MVHGGWYFRGDDEPLSGEDGLRESLAKSIIVGVIVPALLLGLGVWIAASGGFTLPARRGRLVHYSGTWIVISSVAFLSGVATLLVSHYGLRNWLPNSYAYEPVAAVGAVLAVLGMIVFVISALV